MTISAKPRIYCCLAGAEMEWAHPHRTLQEAFAADRLNRILQFLPCLLAKPKDRILLNNRPQDPLWIGPKNAHLLFLDDQPNLVGEQPWLWAESEAAARCFALPDRTSLLRKLASKATLVQWGLAPTGSSWITSEEQLCTWAAHHPGPAVAKRALHSSGRGHFLLPADRERPSSVLQNIAHVIVEEGGVVLQPWWTRLFDFSSQWWCASSATYIGSTVMFNSARGRYLGSTVGPEGWLEELLGNDWTEHEQQCRKVLRHALELGYTGPIGIDSMFIVTPSGPRLVPIVELNPRHTMGWLAVSLQRMQPARWLQFEWRRCRDPGTFPRYIEHRGQRERLGIQPFITLTPSAPTELLQRIHNLHA